MCEAPSTACEASRSHHLRSISRASLRGRSCSLTSHAPRRDRVASNGSERAFALRPAYPSTDKGSNSRSVFSFPLRRRICVRHHLVK